jgi:four helix bundle protein
MKIATFEDIVSWQKGRELYTCLYKDMLKTKNYSYRDQLLRAALSITNNIAEGFDRNSSKELRQFLVIARGSAAEVRSMLYIAKDLDLITKERQEHYMELSKDISRLLTGFIASINKQITESR